MNILKKLRTAALGVALAALALTTTTAVAGSGVGGIFNLGQANTVDAQSTLSGTSTGAWPSPLWSWMRKVSLAISVGARWVLVGSIVSMRSR